MVFYFLILNMLRKKYNIQSDIRMLLERDREVGKVIKFHKEVGVFEEILKQKIADEIIIN